MARYFNLAILTFSLFLSGWSNANTFQTTLTTEVSIDAPITEVFDYASTASHWKIWHPNTFATSGADDHSATENEVIHETLKIETLKIGTLIGPQLDWTVTEHFVPTNWRLSGNDKFGLITFDLEYSFTTHEDGTTGFHRRMSYTMKKTWLFLLFDALIFKPYNERMSKIALNQFKAEMEAD